MDVVVVLNGGARRRGDVGGRCWSTGVTRLGSASRLSPRNNAKLCCAQAAILTRPDCLHVPRGLYCPFPEAHKAKCVGCRSTSRRAEGRHNTLIISVAGAPADTARPTTRTFSDSGLARNGFVRRGSLRRMFVCGSVIVSWTRRPLSVSPQVVVRGTAV